MLISIYHPAHTPSWVCRTCGEPWPCAERKIKFLEDYEGRRRELRTVLAMFFIDATEDLTEPVEALHERFVAWSTPRPSTPQRPSQPSEPNSPFTP